MKNATITISFEQDKLKALQFYADKKDANLQGELDDFLQKLYEKYVPAQTRDYIESLMEQAPMKSKRPSKPSSSTSSTAGDTARLQVQRIIE
jgi:hypothetical protein